MSRWTRAGVRATVRAGTRWSEVIAAAGTHGLIPRSGSSPDVGVVGYTLGGGLPITGRTFGFAADTVHSAEVVLADGSEITVDADHDPELFWGLRGGKGPFCAVTSLTFGLEPVTTINGGALYFAGEQAQALLAAYRDWVGGLPESMTTSIALFRLPPLPQVPEPLRGVLTVGIRIVHIGDPAEAAAVVAPLRSVAPVVLGGVGELPFTAGASIYNDPPGPLPAVAGGALLREVTDADIVGMLTPETAAVTPPIADALFAALAPAAAGGHQVNFADGAAAPDIWGPEVFGRLAAIKTAYDPGNIFRGPLTFAGPVPSPPTPR